MLRDLIADTPTPGAAPGVLVDRESTVADGRLTVYRMDLGGEDAAHERIDAHLDDALSQPQTGDHRLTWLHFEGDVGAAGLKQLGERFRLHSLALEDVQNHGQRPKIDVYRHTLFLTLALPVIENDQLGFQQVSIFIGRDFVLSFHAGAHDVFEAVRERVHGARGRLAHAAVPDYLAYCLADVVVDTSFAVLAGYNDRLEALEDEIFNASGSDLIGVIHGLRRTLIATRKVLLSQNELFLRWIALEHDLVRGETRPYIRDVQDHARRVLDLADGYYDTAGSLLDTHLSLASARLNDVMRVLTLISTIFIPLSFIVGLYGMNFDTKSPWNMPLLGWRYGYPAVLIFMSLMVAVLLIYFRRKRWI